MVRSLVQAMPVLSRLVVALSLGVGGVSASTSPAPPLAPRPRPGTGDFLLLRDGTKRTGTLVGCGPSACRFNGGTVDRAQIDWVGLAGALPPAPQLDNPSRDVVFLAAGEVRIEPLLGVNAREVLTTEGSYPRTSVRWIHLAPPGAGERQSAPVPIVAAAPPAPATQPPPPSPTSGPPSPTPSRPGRTPSSPPGGGYERGALWIGKVTGRWWGDKPVAHTEERFRAEVRLREYRYPLKGITPETMGKSVGTMIRLEHEGTELTSEFHQSGENPFTTMLPENVQTAMELFEVAGKLAAAMQGTTAEKLGEALEDCAGMAGITQGQYSSAEEYVEGLKAAVEQLTEIQTLVNNVEQLDNELPDLQYQAYRVCVERARCQGRPDSDCDGLKPPGNWPDVP